MKRLLKLTGGSFTGRRLYVPDTGVRPATNRVREAIFSTLRSFHEGGVAGLRVLDLFAGSGSLGLEAISRGAKKVTFVDSGGRAISAIRMNLALLEYSADVVRSDVKTYLKRNRSLRYDLVFMDPPYSYGDSGEVVELLLKGLRGGESSGSPIMVHERLYREEPPDFGERSELLRRKRYGQTEILYVRLSP
jgi:16S rRNA (guanine966-N2)-methyltransferase